MGVIQPIPYTAPSGEDLLLRWTLGAQRRIAAFFGTSKIQEILNQYDLGAVPRLIYYCAFDAKGAPPGGMAVEEFEETYPPGDESGHTALVALIEAFSQGGATKNEIEAMLAKEQAKSQIGSKSGASAASASGSPMQNSGTSIPPNSTPSPSDTPTPSESPTTAPE